MKTVAALALAAGLAAAATYENTTTYFTSAPQNGVYYPRILGPSTWIDNVIFGNWDNPQARLTEKTNKCAGICPTNPDGVYLLSVNSTKTASIRRSTGDIHAAFDLFGAYMGCIGLGIEADNSTRLQGQPCELYVQGRTKGGRTVAQHFVYDATVVPGTDADVDPDHQFLQHFEFDSTWRNLVTVTFGPIVRRPSKKFPYPETVYIDEVSHGSWV